MAKFCPACGTGLADAAKFCPDCGAQIPAAQQPQQPCIQPQPPAPPPPPAKKKPKALFIALGAAALVIVLIVVIAVLGKGDDTSPSPITRPTTTAAAETQSPVPTVSPLVGLWRIEDEDGVELITLDGDGTFSTAMHFFGSGGHINRLFGSYRMEGSQLVFCDVTDDEGEACDDMRFACNVSGDTLALDDAGTYTRVEPEDRDAVLIDPFAPYPYPFEDSPATPPSATSRTGATTQPTQPPATTRLPSSGGNSLVGMWWRASLAYSGFIYLHFDSNGGFVQEVRFYISDYVTTWEEAYKGSYSISGNTFTLTYKSAEHKDAGKTWEPIALPDSRTLTYTFGYLEHRGTIFDITNGGLPPFNAPVTILPDERSSDPRVATRFYESNQNTSVFGR